MSHIQDMPPTVSVVMAVRDGERWLRETLASLSRQTFAGYEAVIVDDGSTDGTPAILAEAARDPRLRILTRPGEGLVKALNQGLAAAQAPLVARLDADDLAEPERFARQVTFLEAHPEVAALGSALRIIDQEGRILRTQKYPCGPRKVAEAMLSGCALAHPAVMMRREAVIAAGGYREAFRHAEDYDLWLRLGERHALDNLPEPLLRYRVHGGSVSFRHRRQQVLATFVARLCARARRTGRTEPLRDDRAPLEERTLGELELTKADEAAFRFESARAALDQAGPDTDEAWLNQAIEEAWRLRAHLPAGRLARRCLLPYSRRCSSEGRRELAEEWRRRAFTLAPFSSCWATLTARRPRG